MGVPQVKSETVPHRWGVGKKKLKKEADHSRLAGGSFNKQRNSHTRLVLDNCKTNGALHPLTRTLKVYREALVGSVAYIFQMVSLTHCFLKVMSLKTAPSVGIVGGTYIPRTEEG